MNEAKANALFEDEMLEHLDAVFDAALRFSGNASDADDLVQATMLKAYRFLDSYKTGTNARAWLLTILRNTFLNERRRQQRQPAAMDLEPERTADPASLDKDTPADNADTSDEGREAMMDNISEEVVQAINELSEDYRRALLLCDIDDYTYREIAAIVSCPVGTVRSRISRARQQLRRRLAAFADDEGITD